MACLVVWDLKTVPDGSSLAAVRSNDGDEDVQNADCRVDSPLHRSIISIGRLIAHFDVDRWRISSVYAWHVAMHSEREIIKQFFDTLADLKPQLVSWDAFPILEYRRNALQTRNAAVFCRTT